MEKNKNSFLDSCSQVREFDKDFVYEESGDFSVVEDDGFLHVRNHGVRVGFYLGEELSKSKFKSRSNQVLRQLGLSVRV